MRKITKVDCSFTRQDHRWRSLNFKALYKRELHRWYSITVGHEVILAKILRINL